MGSDAWDGNGTGNSFWVWFFFPFGEFGAKDLCGGGAVLGSAASPSPGDITLCPQELMSYCASDVRATYEVFQEQLPLFMER